ncbi:kinesin-like nuclear fusion protein [Pestalotiopsis sp. IQ-011]
MSAAVETLSLEAKVAIVTGAGRDSGIGAAIATALARNGAAVAINYFSDSTAPSAQAVADRLKTEYGARAVPIQANVETEEGAAALVEKTLAAFGVDHVDILVNNAGCNLPGSTDDTPWDNIEAQFSKNVYAAVRVVRAALPHIPRGGRIVNISTIASRYWIEGLTFYGAAKAALDSLTQSWAAEFGRKYGVTVNSVAPGPIDTDESRKFARDNPNGHKAMQDLIDVTRAADRMGQVEDVADAVLLLAQEKSRWITGQYIDTSGGIVGH